MVRVIAQIKNDTNKNVSILNEKTISVHLSEETKFFDFDKLYSNNCDSKYIYKTEFDNLSKGMNIFCYHNYENNLENITEILDFVINKLNYYCEISIIETNKNNTTDFFSPNKKLFLYSTKKIKKTWELITTQEDYQNFKTNLSYLKLNHNQLIFSFNSPLTKQEINLVLIHNNEKYYYNPLNILLECINSKKLYYSNDNISIIFNKIIKSHENNIIFLKLDSEKDLTSVYDLSKKMFPINRDKNRFIPFKRKKSRYLEDLLLEKKIQKSNIKILKPKFSVKTDDDIPLLKKSNSPKQKLLNINIDDIADAILCKRQTDYNYKKKFHTLASLNRFLYDSVIRNQIIIENTFDKPIDKKLTIEMKQNLKIILDFVMTELDRI